MGRGEEIQSDGAVSGDSMGLSTKTQAEASLRTISAVLPCIYHTFSQTV